MNTYKSLPPDAPLPIYTSNQSINWTFGDPGTALIPDSVKITWRMSFTDSNGDPFTGNEEVYFDQYAGYHGLIAKVIGGTVAYSTIDPDVPYARKVTMLGRAKYFDSTMGSENSALEGRNIPPAYQKVALSGAKYDGGVGAGQVQACVKPVFSLNAMTGVLPFQQSGSWTVQLFFEPIENFLYGPDAYGCNYEITDVNLSYSVVPMPPTPNAVPISMTVFQYQPVTFTTDQANVQVKCPMQLCDGFMTSFIANSTFQDRPSSTSGGSNINALQYPPGLDRVEYLLNDSTSNALVAYPLLTAQEVLLTSNGFLGGRVTSNSFQSEQENYIIALNFGAPLDLTQTLFGLQLYTDVGSTGETYRVSTYFRGYMVFGNTVVAQ